MIRYQSQQAGLSDRVVKAEAAGAAMREALSNLVAAIKPHSTYHPEAHASLGQLGWILRSLWVQD